MLAFVVFLLALTSVSSTLAAATPKGDISSIKETFIQKYPDLVHWYERAAERVQTNATASPGDLDEVREVLKGGKQKIYEFVNSPLFDLFGSMIIDRTVNMVSPLLGILPLKEFREFINIVGKKPELYKVIFREPEDDESIVKILPNAAMFDQWLTNSTKKIVDEVVDTASSSAGGDLEGDFDLLRSGNIGDASTAPKPVPPPLSQ